MIWYFWIRSYFQFQYVVLALTEQEWLALCTFPKTDTKWDCLITFPIGILAAAKVLAKSRLNSFIVPERAVEVWPKRHICFFPSPFSDRRTCRHCRACFSVFKCCFTRNFLSVGKDTSQNLQRIIFDDLSVSQTFGPPSSVTKRSIYLLVSPSAFQKQMSVPVYSEKTMWFDVKYLTAKVVSHF